MSNVDPSSVLNPASFLSFVPGLIGTATTEGRFVRLAKGWEDLLGYPIKTLEGTNFIDLVHPDDVEMTRTALSAIVDDATPHEFVNRYRRADGSYAVLSWQTALSDDGNIYFLATDVTERQKNQDQLDSLLQRLKDVSEIAKIGGWELDIATDQLRWDDQTFRIHELEPGSELSVEKAVEFYAPEAREMVADSVARGIELGTSWTFEAPLITAKGNRVWVMASGRAVYRDGQPIRLTGIFQDITEMKKRAIELEDLLASAETLRGEADKANLAKSMFLANMSHEIRTPLNGMLGMTELLKRQDLSEKQQLYVDNLEGLGRSLQTLVEDILDISKIEAGQISLISQDFDLDDVISQSIAIIEPEAAKKSLKLDLYDDQAVAKERFGDAKRLRQVLLNLLGNAVKFTESGSVSLHVQETGPDLVRFEVHDTGPGIDPEDHEEIFDRFAQADQSSQRAFDGAGLGLAISRELVELAGGRMGVNSALGEGSQFWFEWPLPRTASTVRIENDTATNGDTSDTKSAGCVLVAEDKPINFRVLYEALSAAGYEVCHAKTGAEAVQMNADLKPDLVMMDIHMPEMSGDQAISEIKERAGHVPPIFAVTADATPELRSKVEKLGVEAVFIKPYDLDAIIEQTRRFTAHIAR